MQIQIQMSTNLIYYYHQTHKIKLKINKIATKFLHKITHNNQKNHRQITYLPKNKILIKIYLSILLLKNPIKL